MADHRSYTHNLSSCEIKAWKKSGLNGSAGRAQSVEHCTGIAEVMGSNPVQAWIFSTAQVVCITAMINHKLNIFLCSSNIWSFIYSFTMNIKVQLTD